MGIKIKLSDNYAIDSLSGQLVVPRYCLGDNPKVCASQPELRQLRPRGFITKRPEFLDTCQVAVKPIDKEPVVKAIGINSYVISTLKELVTFKEMIHIPRISIKPTIS